MLKDFFKKSDIETNTTENENKTEIPKGLWKKCNYCKKPIYTEDVVSENYICPKCKKYFRVPALERIENIFDKNSFIEWNRKMDSENPLDFPGYEKKLQITREKTGLKEAVITGTAEIFGEKTAFGVCDSRFMMASMGKVVGEKLTRMVERATNEKLPVIIFCASGGARMQEGIVSLMQMAKISAALKTHSEAGLLYVSVLTDPTTGGVTASFAMLGDIILAEPAALIGFAGPRVIEQTIHEKLPEGFQRSEFLLEHGFIDAIVERNKLRTTLEKILKIHAASNNLLKKRNKSVKNFVKEKNNSLKKPKELSAWDHVSLSRKSGRIISKDIIDGIFEDFFEAHGDRYFGDDKAIVGGIAYFKGVPVTVIGQEKGKNTRENIETNFGMPKPEGYRKALRLMRQAEKFSRPIICIVDTPGAFCGIEAEERGQGEAIANNLFEMSSLKVPVLTIIIGEGGSGGALAMAVANEVWMLENATYSILSPEGFATILWKDGKRAAEAAKYMKITADDLSKLGMIEKIIPEKYSDKIMDYDYTISYISDNLYNFIEKYADINKEEIVSQRYRRFRNM